MMSKPDTKLTTALMEIAISRHLRKLGVYLCFEVGMPYVTASGEMLLTGRVDERVDLLQYDSKGVWRFYELKLSVKDFRSKHKWTFYGHFNYFVMPHEVYAVVEKEIPAHVGVYLVRQDEYGRLFVDSAKKAKRQELGVDETALKYKFMQALSREVDKSLRSKSQEYEKERIEKYHKNDYNNQPEWLQRSVAQ